ncbi:MAG: carboxymuconolactone decarboxylase family protein [Alphaproteobacteria bacterium]
MRITIPRVKPLQDDELGEEQREIMKPLTRNGRVFNIFRSMIHHPVLFKNWLTFANYVLSKRSSISARDREIAILRIGWLCKAEYEWAQHVIIGKAAGITDEEIDRIAAGPDASGWDAFDAAIVRATDELHKDKIVSDATWKTLSGRYNEQQCMDLVFAVGQYNLVSMALNTFGVQLDPGLKGFKK